MGDDHGNATTGADREDGFGQSGLALSVKVRVRLIQNHEKRVAVEGTGNGLPPLGGPVQI